MNLVYSRRSLIETSLLKWEVSGKSKCEWAMLSIWPAEIRERVVIEVIERISSRKRSWNLL